VDGHGHLDVYPAAFTGHQRPVEQQVFIAIIAAMLGTTNAASSFILRWKVQFACAVVWWAAAVISLFSNVTQSSLVFLLAIFLCQIVFGVYGMVRKRARAGRGRSMPELPELNPVIHGKLRLALLSLLAGVEEAEFTWLRVKTGSTDGNLGAQLLKLEEAGYIAVEKKFVQRKPQTLYRMTEAGRQALTEYVQALKSLLGPAINGKREPSSLGMEAFADALHDAEVIRQVVDGVERAGERSPDCIRWRK